MSPTSLWPFRFSAPSQNQSVLADKAYDAACADG
jgi:hypothetical protein